MAQDNLTQEPVAPAPEASAVPSSEDLQQQIKATTTREAWLRELLRHAQAELKELNAQLSERKAADTSRMADNLLFDHEAAITDLEARYIAQTKRIKRLKHLWAQEKSSLDDLNRRVESAAMAQAETIGETLEAAETVTPETKPGFKPKKRHAIGAVILAPFLLSLCYFLLYASPMYISQARFAIRSADSGVSVGNELASMLFSTGGSNNDMYILEDYIGSLDIVQDIDKELGIVSHYSSPDRDLLSRLWSSPTQDELVRYWQKIVSPALDPDTGIVTLDIRAYSPQMAQALNKAVLSRSEALVNAMNARAQKDAVELAQKEVTRAEERVRMAQEAMRAFRDSHSLLDPKVTAQGLQKLLSGLEAEATSLRTKILEAEAFMHKDAPLLQSLNQSLRAVEKQIAEETHRVAGVSDTQGSLNAIVGSYEDLVLEEEFAQKQLVSAMASLEQARIKQSAQTRYVVAYQQPTLPDESLYPRPFLFALYIFMGTILLLGIFSLIGASIREHAGF